MAPVLPGRDLLNDFTTTLASAFEGLDEEELQYVTADVIRQHRISVELAQRAYERSLVADNEADQEELHSRYADALRVTSVQIALISALTDKLGYTPCVPTDAPDVN